MSPCYHVVLHRSSENSTPFHSRLDSSFVTPPGVPRFVEHMCGASPCKECIHSWVGVGLIWEPLTLHPRAPQRKGSRLEAHRGVQQEIRAQNMHHWGPLTLVFGSLFIIELRRKCGSLGPTSIYFLQRIGPPFSSGSSRNVPRSIWNIYLL